MNLRLFVVLPAVLLLPLHAQSFDCARAATPREHAVCNDVGLRTLDSDVAREYFRVHSGVPASSSASVLADQRIWLKQIDSACSAKVRANTSLNDCLITEYKARLTELQQDKPLEDGHWLITTQDRGDMRPEILTPTPAEQKWNNAVAAQIADRNNAAAQLLADSRKEASGVGGDRAENMEVNEGWHLAGANSHLIVTRFKHFEYTGGAHPSTSFTDWNWSLDLNREVKPTDVFRDGSDWHKAVIASAKQQLIKANVPIWDGKGFEDGMAQAVGSAAEWQLTHDGLHMQFQQYQITAYAFGMPEVCFSWKDLKPYLNPAWKTEQLPQRVPDPADQ